jgi:hypothetical protein
MLHTPNDPNIEEPDCGHVSSSSSSTTDSLLPSSHSSYYLLRSNQPGLCLEIENPDTELPVLTFDFKAD